MHALYVHMKGFLVFLLPQNSEKLVFVCFTEGKKKDLRVPVKVLGENFIFLTLFNLMTQSLRKPFHVEFVSYF